jgi:hypothetical protein
MDVTNRVEISLRAAGDHLGVDRQGRDDLKQFWAVAESHGAKWVPETGFHEFGAPYELVVEFAKAAGPIIGPVIAAALTAWLQGRAGRKVRMKVGDIEIEASTQEEFDRLLATALALKADQTKPAEGKE